MKKRYFFFKNFGTIILIAFLGTMISIILTSMGMWTVGYLGIATALSLKHCWAFGSLISATDPISVLAIFKEVNADDTLYSLIFGESILNDAISIVMYRTIRQIGITENDDIVKEGILASYHFVMLVLGSSAIGIFLALMISIVLKYQLNNLKQTFHNFDIILMCLIPWVSYLMAEGLAMSGIVSILANGVYLAHYAAPNMST